MKMMKLFVALFIGQIFSFHGYGQDTLAKNEYETVHTKKIDRPNAIFLAPLNLFNPNNPSFQIGYERFIANRWSFQIEGGVIINHSVINYVADWSKGINVRDCPYTNKGFRVTASTKYFLTTEKFFKFYISPELFYQKNKSGIVRSFLVSDPDFEYSFGRPEEGQNGYRHFFYNNEEKMGVNFKLGFTVGQRFFIDFHYGLGVAFRNIIQTGLENPDDEIYDSFGIFDKTSRNKWGLTLPFNFKIGLRF
jgi:hypothetical protein